MRLRTLILSGLAATSVAMAFNAAAQDESFSINPGVNDAWYNRDTNGQGFFFNLFPDTGVFFMSWFTYDTERPPEDVTAILGEPGHRWLTAAGTWADGNSVTLDVTNTSGGIFDNAEPAVENEEGYGTITVTFADCDSATLDYEIPSLELSGSMNITRVAKDNVALCEALASGE